MKRHILFNYIYFNCTYTCCAIYINIYYIYRYAYLEMNFNGMKFNKEKCEKREVCDAKSTTSCLGKKAVKLPFKSELQVVKSAFKSKLIKSKSGSNIMVESELKRSFWQEILCRCESLEVETL